MTLTPEEAVEVVRLKYARTQEGVNIVNWHVRGGDRLYQIQGPPHSYHLPFPDKPWLLLHYDDAEDWASLGWYFTELDALTRMQEHSDDEDRQVELDEAYEAEYGPAARTQLIGLSLFWGGVAAMVGGSILITRWLIRRRKT